MLNVWPAAVLAVEVGVRRRAIRGEAAAAEAAQSVQPLISTPLIFRLQ